MHLHTSERQLRTDFLKFSSIEIKEDVIAPLLVVVVVVHVSKGDGDVPSQTKNESERSDVHTVQIFCGAENQGGGAIPVPRNS